MRSSFLPITLPNEGVYDNMTKQSNKRTGIHLFLINAFVFIPAAQYTPFLSAYFAKAGISALEIGILLTIGPIVSIIIQPIWAYISDRTGKRKLVLCFVVLGTALSILSYYIGRSFLSFFIAAMLLAFFVTSIIPLNDANTLHIAHKNGLDFSKIRMGGTIGYAITVIFAGEIVKSIPSIGFLMGSIGYAILFLLIVRLPKEENTDPPPSEPKHTSVGHKEKKSLLHIFESKEIYFILAFAFINQVGLSFNYSFLGVYMLNMGMTESTMGLINCISALSELPVLFLINHIIKRISPMKISLIACFLLGLRILAVTGGSLPFVIMSAVLHGITFMTVYFSCAIFISKNVKPENQSKGQSILTIIQAGLASITGNIAGGFLVDQLGLKASYIIMASSVIIIAGLIALLQYSYEKKHPVNVA